MKQLFASLALITSSIAIAQTNNLGDQAMTEVTNQTKEATKEGARALGEALGSATWGVRANALINASSLGNLASIDELKKSGFNIGVSAKVDLGSNFFVNPELYYAHVGTSELDLPILFGYEIVPERFALVVGPNLMYTFSKNSEKDIQQAFVKGMAEDYQGLSSMFKFGFQAGVQAYFGNFLLSAKYEGALSDQVVNMVNSATGQKFEEKVKTNYFSVGLGYNFGK